MPAATTYTTTQKIRDEAWFTNNINIWDSQIDGYRVQANGRLNTMVGQKYTLPLSTSKLSGSPAEALLDLIEMLLAAGVLQYTKTMKLIVIDYDETPEIINAFLAIYKIVLNRLAIMAIMHVPFEFLPNPFSDFSWEESWLDFKWSLDNTKTWKDLMQEKEEIGIKEEINEIEL